jgi:hypothetical protein
MYKIGLEAGKTPVKRTQSNEHTILLRARYVQKFSERSGRGLVRKLQRASVTR